LKRKCKAWIKPSRYFTFHGVNCCHSESETIPKQLTLLAYRATQLLRFAMTLKWLAARQHPLVPGSRVSLRTPRLVQGSLLLGWLILPVYYCLFTTVGEDVSKTAFKLATPALS
jgi:hypothetical protein